MVGALPIVVGLCMASRAAVAAKVDTVAAIWIYAGDDDWISRCL